MKQLKAETLEDLKSIIVEHGSDALFRGQTSHFGEPSSPSVVTSFDRKGCIPREMLKWSKYAKNVLDAFQQQHSNSLGFTQALLQHYGWRSFYVDCSSEPTVAAWFASQKYTEQTTVEMTEDYQERPVWLRKRMAKYAFEQGEGHLYIIDKPMASKVGLVDLAAISIEGSFCRTEAQRAWLIGPLQMASLPAECFRAHVIADRALLRDYAAEQGRLGTETLFPSSSDDPILDALLSLPWREIKGVRDDKFRISAFRRALELPEYEESFVKIAWPRTAFYCGESVADKFESIDGDPFGGINIKVPDTVLFGTAHIDSPMRFPNVEALLRKHGTVTFEIDELIQYVQARGNTLYQKGIGVIPHEANLFEVCELMVEHPGLDMTRVGFGKGWFYRLDASGVWAREKHDGECDCGNAEVHGGHISALHIAEAYLDEPDEFRH
ncbi:hypothetical protein A8A54_04475 [Brucella pseudogrignonensis]|uniref:FRG domain-containing protein n=1 Tax=Brucella pseudogrignonensis TaxID=419475 RepID=UPI0007DAA6B1|nr:FRG domain-containing protein [Brucella pseudogrignonensis]ANG95807.1 hypothetical protein A8A54_04475 [Brucella pseudogrignonensis]